MLAGLIPGRGTCLGCSFFPSPGLDATNPSIGAYEATSPCVSHMSDVSLSPLKKEMIMFLGEDKKSFC